MKKIILSSVLIAGLGFTGCGLSMPSVPGIPGSAQSTGKSLSGNDIDAMLTAAEAGKKLLRKSTIEITGILLGSKAKEELQAKLDSASKIEDPKEKDAKIAEVLSNAATEAIKQGESAEGKEKMKNLSDKQNKQALKAITNFALAGLVDYKAVKLGQAIVEGAKNDPMGAAKFANKLGEIKDTLSTLPEQAAEIGKMTTSLIAIAKTGGIAVEMPSESKVTEASTSSRD